MKAEIPATVGEYEEKEKRSVEDEKSDNCMEVMLRKAVCCEYVRAEAGMVLSADN